MKERIQFLFIYFSFWVVYFLAARSIFLGYHLDQSKLLTLELIGGTFWNGLRMDMAMAGYLSILPFFWVSFSNFIKKSIFENTLFSYTLICVFIVTLIVVVDLEVYNVWDYRIDATPLNYLKTPKEAFASVRSSPVIQLVISYILLIIVASYFVYRIIAKNISVWKHIDHFPFLPVSLVFTFLLIIPIRGSVGVAPMNQSTVYFSNNNFANITAVNATWNFFNSLVNKTYDKDNPYTYLPKEEIEMAMETLYSPKGKAYPILKRGIKKPNVLVVVWESFTQKVVDTLINGQEVTPYFNRLKNEGIYFANAYASGDRTDKGLVAILSGYPAQTVHSIVKSPEKTHKLPVLSKDFSKAGYRTEFYYGGETEFANIKSYLLTADFDNITDLHDFPTEYHTTNWGVHDEQIFKRFLKDHEHSVSRPFFSTLLTLSSHEPFDVPLDSARFAGKDEQSLFINSLYYTDLQLKKFVDEAKKQAWWENSIVIVVADHGHRMPELGHKAESFRIPILWTGGAINKPAEVSAVVSQVDLAKSLLGQLGLPADAYGWSKDVFRKSGQQWAYFAFNDGIGFIQPNKTWLFDNIGKKNILQLGDVDKKDIRNAKALLQKSFQDYLEK